MDKHGHYYSPYTGMRYATGFVTPVNLEKRNKKYCTNYSIGKTDGMVGHTGVFVNYSAAKALYESISDEDVNLHVFKFAIVKMTISVDLQRAEFGFRHAPTVIGKNIISMRRMDIR